MFEVRVLDSTNIVVETVIKQISAGHYWLFQLNPKRPDYLQTWRTGVKKLDFLVGLLEREGFETCMYPHGLPADLEDIEGFCLVCSVPGAKWKANECPASRFIDALGEKERERREKYEK